MFGHDRMNLFFLLGCYANRLDCANRPYTCMTATNRPTFDSLQYKQYEPELGPGLIYTRAAAGEDSPGVVITAHIFHSGKVLMSGAKAMRG